MTIFEKLRGFFTTFSRHDSKSIADMAIEILEKTNDGDDLSPGHLYLVQEAVNHGLTEAGEVAFFELHANVLKGYVRPWFCGIENLTRDHQGFVYWKGVQVEHYDHDHWREENWQQKMMKDAEELGSRCRFLESKGIKPTTNTAIWEWEKYAERQVEGGSFT